MHTASKTVRHHAIAADVTLDALTDASDPSEVSLTAERFGVREPFLSWLARTPAKIGIAFLREVAGNK